MTSTNKNIAIFDMGNIPSFEKISISEGREITPVYSKGGKIPTGLRPSGNTSCKILLWSGDEYKETYR